MTTGIAGLAAALLPLEGDTSWRGDGACRWYPTDWWFPVSEQASAVALDICETCPVLLECMDYGLAHPSLHGVWGGLSENQRHRIRGGKDRNHHEEARRKIELRTERRRRTRRATTSTSGSSSHERAGR